MCEESSVIVDHQRILNVARYGKTPLALLSVSNDHGRTWTIATTACAPRPPPQRLKDCLDVNFDAAVNTEAQKRGYLTMQPCEARAGLHCRSIKVFWALAISVIMDYTRATMFAYSYSMSHKGDVRVKVEIFTRFCSFSQSHGA